MSAIDRSPTLAKLAEESPKDCTLRGADRSWFCGAERYEEAIVDLEEQLAGAAARAEKAERDLRVFQAGLTDVLRAYNVPAMPSWPDAIHWLARHGSE